jgi:hypothetical protein
MSTKEQKNPPKEKAEQDNVVVRLMRSSYAVGLKTAMDMSVKALDMPADILTEMGVAEEQAKRFKERNHKFIDGLYEGVDGITKKGASLITAPLKAMGKVVAKLTAEGGEEVTADVGKAPKNAKRGKAAGKVKPKTAKAKARVKAAAKKPSAAGRKAKAEVVKTMEAVEEEAGEKLAA